MPNTISEEDRLRLQKALKRCPEGTLEAAIHFNECGDLESAKVVVSGAISRFLEPHLRGKLAQPDCDQLRLADDLGVDSLTIVEIVVLVEDSLKVSIDNQDLRDLRTLRDVNCYVEAKIKGEEPVPSAAHFTFIDIAEILPHQQPFLFLQEASVNGDCMEGSYHISGQEFFLEGHFKNNPVFPASIMMEALGQLAVFYLLKAENEAFKAPRDPASIYFIASNGVRVQRICKPGDTLRLSVKPIKIRHPLAIFEGSIQVNGEKTATAEAIQLTFDYLKPEA